MGFLSIKIGGTELDSVPPFLGEESSLGLLMCPWLIGVVTHLTGNDILVIDSVHIVTGVVGCLGRFIVLIHSASLGGELQRTIVRVCGVKSTKE